jgi:hypothetical protein
MIVGAFLVFALAQNTVNPDSALVAQFEDHVAAYGKATSKLKSGLSPLKPTASPETLTQRQTELAHLIEQARPNAAQGDFFTPPIAAEFRRLIGIALEGRGKPRVVKSLQHAEPVEVALKVNTPYPAVPLQSTPPTLLANLPRLPAGLDYRIAGHALILRDVQANLILDFIPRALP